MDISKLILDYLKVVLTAPVLFSIVAIIFIFQFREDIKALLLRIAKIRLPGGTELSTSQSNRPTSEGSKMEMEPTASKEVQIKGLPSGMPPQEQQAIEQIIRSHIATAYLWEYRYLNYFLVRGTQEVLDWLIGLKQPTIYAHYDSTWLPLVPSANERAARINALQAHHLVQQDPNGLLIVTPKGLEYQGWRGTLPPLTT